MERAAATKQDVARRSRQRRRPGKSRRRRAQR
jgi:hypothetical protein